VKHGRKTASQDGRIAGTVGWPAADSMRFCVIESVESSHLGRARVTARTDAFGFVAYVDVFWAMT
jgi:hypothetical protein